MGEVDVFLDCFGEIEDARLDCKVVYPVEELLFLTLCPVISGASG